MRGLLSLALLLAGFTSAAPGQSQQRWSVQGSGALVFPTASESDDFENSTRLGWEAQIRHTFSRFSLGGGYQRSTVYQFASGDFSAAVSVFFLEPRYVIVAGSRAAVYLAGRAGMSELVCSPSEDCTDQGAHFAAGGGGGVLVRLGTRVALDLGSQYFTTQYDIAAGQTRTAGYILARLGLSVGL